MSHVFCSDKWMNGLSESIRSIDRNILSGTDVDQEICVFGFTAFELSCLVWPIWLVAAFEATNVLRIARWPASLSS